MKRMMRNAIIAILALSMMSCGGKKEENQTVQKEDSTQAQPVKVMVLSPQKIAKTLDITTTLEGYETMNISPSITGNIEKIHVEVGDKVSTGQALVTMNQQQYNNAKLMVANLTTEMRRVEALKETGNVTEQVYDQTKLGFDQAKQSLDFLTKNTFVKADFAGVISAKNYQNGELYSGAPILVLTQIRTLKAFINIPETYFPLVKEGMEISLKTDIYTNKIFKGTIEIIYPTIDATTHTFKVKVKIPNNDETLRPGMYSHALLALGEIDAMVVPYQSVLKLQGSNDRYVYLNDNGVAKRVAVTLGQRFDDKIEIISNEIKTGAQLITTGQARLIEGSVIKVVE